MLKGRNAVKSWSWMKWSSCFMHKSCLDASVFLTSLHSLPPLFLLAVIGGCTTRTQPHLQLSSPTRMTALKWGLSMSRQPILSVMRLINIFFLQNLSVALSTPIPQLIHFTCCNLSWNSFYYSFGTEDTASKTVHAFDSKHFWDESTLFQVEIQESNYK